MAKKVEITSKPLGGKIFLLLVPTTNAKNAPFSTHFYLILMISMAYEVEIGWKSKSYFHPVLNCIKISAV